jgi:hypothetical protein
VAECFDAAETCSKPRVGRLDSLPRCRKELVRLYREARHGELAPQTATKLAHLVGLIGRMIEASDLDTLEQRMVALEHLAKARK